MIPTRRSLLTRLKSWDDEEGWRQFFDTYWKLIYRFAVRTGLGDAAAEDVVQETIISVAKQMPSFQYDPAVGSFKSWLLQITRRRIADHRRREQRRVRTAEPVPSRKGQTDLIERVPDSAGGDLEALWDDEWQQHVLDAARQALKRRVEAKHFQIFDCYVLKQWPVRDVARTFGVSAGQVYLIKHRLVPLLEREIRRAQAGGS